MNRYSGVLCFLLVFCIEYSASGQKYYDMAKHSTTVHLKGVYDSKKNAFENATKEFLDAINIAYCSNQDPKLPGNIANNQINERLGNLWAVSPFFSVKPEVIENVLSAGKGNYEIRNVQIVFEEAETGYEQQDAVLLFNKNGKILDFKIGLGMWSPRLFSADISVTDLRRRQIIVSFVEDFRTSYTLKDIAYLERVFSDKALIITGKVLKETLQEELQPKVEYKVQTKSQYLSNLKALFAVTKMISINFDSIEVVQHPKLSHIYGVKLKQTWNSEKIKGGKYNDVGNLFLVIDFLNEERPKIWVRAWSLDDFFSLDNFDINDIR